MLAAAAAVFEGGALNRAALFAALLAAGMTGACQRDPARVPITAEAVVAMPAPIETPVALAAMPATPISDPTADEVAPDGRIVLNLDASADIAPATTLTFERIVSDSRCPAGVQCVWAGEVTIALLLKSPLGSKTFELSQTDNKQSALAFTVELLSYGPCPGGAPAVTPLPGECASLKVSADPAQ